MSQRCRPVTKGLVSKERKRHQACTGGHGEKATEGPAVIKRGLRRNQHCQHLNLGLTASTTVRTSISVVQATHTMAFCYDTPTVCPRRRTGILYIPNAPPISAPLVGMLTFTIPQSDPFGLCVEREARLRATDRN